MPKPIHAGVRFIPGTGSLVRHWRALIVQRLGAWSQDKLRAFVVGCGCAAFVGSTAGYVFGGIPIIGISLWDAIIGAAIGAALAFGQDLYLRRVRDGLAGIRRFGRRGAIAGAVGGAGLVAVRLLAGPSAWSMVIAWAFESALMGVLIAPVIPNLPVRKSAGYGALAGATGAVVMMACGSTGLPGVMCVALGDSLKGLLLGAAIAIAERTTAGASITVYWNPQEFSTLLLGPEPINFGSSRAANVHIASARPVPPVAASILVRDGRIVQIDRVRNTESLLRDGQRICIGNVVVAVNYSARAASVIADSQAQSIQGHRT